MDYKNLLQIWDLDVDDVESETSKWSSGVKFDQPVNLQVVSLSGATEYPGHNSTGRCDSCYAHNASDANWCIECGTAIISRASFISTTDNEISSIPKRNTSTSSHVHSDHTAPPKRHWETPKRYWATSKHYAWRKPRSRIPCNSESNFAVPSLDLHNGINFLEYKSDYKVRITLIMTVVILFQP